MCRATGLSAAFVRWRAVCNYGQRSDRAKLCVKNTCTGSYNLGHNALVSAPEVDRTMPDVAVTENFADLCTVGRRQGAYQIQHRIEFISVRSAAFDADPVPAILRPRVATHRIAVPQEALDSTPNHTAHKVALHPRRHAWRRRTIQKATTGDASIQRAVT